MFLLVTRLCDAMRVACWDYVDSSATEIMKSAALLSIDSETLCAIVSRDSLQVCELTLHTSFSLGSYPSSLYFNSW